jgi:hypothetical protein
VCGITCNTGYADCDASLTNGCEVNLNSDTGHCGACETTCDSTNGTASCSAGVCGITCNTGYGDCDGQASTGCEVNLDTDTTHCGSCVVACSANNGAPSCSAGLCGISCYPGFADCNLSSVDGCEANLDTDPAHCGACTHACGSTNGFPTCSSGACGITCAAGWADCDGALVNGCEVNILSDPANCNGCGNVCDATNGSPSCDAGSCAITCDVGYGNCDPQAGGCEANLTTDPNNCNACGNACPTPANAAPGCAGGTCGIGSCDTGWADCDALVDDGCEVNVAADVSNCGACGTVCAAPNASPECAAGNCAIQACTAGWMDYDGAFADGCECKTPTTSGTCSSPRALGSISPNMTVISNLDGIPGGAEAYYVVTFPPQSTYYGVGTPTIQFDRNDGGNAVFDVLPSCGATPYSCGSGGIAMNRTQYSFTDYPRPSADYYPSRGAAWPSTVYIRVHQKPGTTGCPTYQLYISR